MTWKCRWCGSTEKHDRRKCWGKSERRIEITRQHVVARPEQYQEAFSKRWKNHKRPKISDLLQGEDLKEYYYLRRIRMTPFAALKVMSRLDVFEKLEIEEKESYD